MHRFAVQYGCPEHKLGKKAGSSGRWVWNWCGVLLSHNKGRGRLRSKALQVIPVEIQVAGRYRQGTLMLRRNWYPQASYCT